MENSRTTVTIDHEAIPGFMNAMAKRYPIQDASLVSGLEPGQNIAFRVVAEDSCSLTRGFNGGSV